MKEIMYRKLGVRDAFALIEVLIGIALLSATIISISGLTISMMRSNAMNKNHLIATELSREGLEMVKIIRDTNFMHYRYWLTDLHEGSEAYESVISKDSMGNFVATPTGGDSDAGRLYLSSTFPFYTVDETAGESSPFTRIITVTPVLTNTRPGGGEYDTALNPNHILQVQVASEVSWMERGRVKNVTLYTRLTDWNS